MNITTESSDYRIAVEESQITEAQRLILGQGEARFGAPGEELRTTIGAIQDIERLEQLSLRLLVVGNWSELLAENGHS